MICFRCLCDVGEVDELFKHLKYIHGLTSGKSVFVICSQNGCPETFTYISSYKRHLLSKHCSDLEGSQSVENETVYQDIFEDESADDAETCTTNQKETGNMLDTLKETFFLFLTSLKASAVPHTYIDKLVREIEELMNNVLTNLFKQVLNDLETVDVESLNICFFQKYFHKVQNIFSQFRTRYMQDQYLVDRDVLIPPEERTLGKSFATRDHSGHAQQQLVTETFQYVPICKLLKKYLEQPGVMKAILSQHNSQDGCILKTYRDGFHFQTKHVSCEDVPTIPLLLYADDYETGNPLGSRKGEHKLVAFYISVLSLPIKYQASLNNILLAACAKRKVVNKYGIDSVLSAIVDDLQVLEKEGLEISSTDFKGIVKPVLFQVIGDNLGLHELLGFVGSFSANYPCRFCKAPKEIIRRQLTPDSALLRSKETFHEDLALDDTSRTGMKRSSELNNLEQFHVSENYAPDITHDFLEGIMPLEVKLVLNSLIDKGQVTLQQVNDRISSFNYGFVDKKNKPSPIPQSALKNPRGASGQKAAQMRCLCLYLPIMLGDLIDESSDEWEVLLLAVDIYKIVVAPYITRSATFFLKALIKDHHQLFLQVFDGSLIPKHHFVVHYPQLIRLLGPLEQYSTIRKEAKHKPFKSWARACNNYKNVAKTVSRRHQEQQSYVFLQGKTLSCEMDIKNQFPAQISTFEEAQHICATLDCSQDEFIHVADKLTVHSYEFKLGCLVLTEWDENGPVCAQLKNIIIHKAVALFVLLVYETEYYNRHLQAYAVSECVGRIKIMEPLDLLVPRPLHMVRSLDVNDKFNYIITPFQIV